MFTCRVAAFECLLSDESNPYLQKFPRYSQVGLQPSTMVCVRFPLPKTTPPENFLAGGGIVGSGHLQILIYLVALNLKPAGGMA